MSLDNNLSPDLTKFKSLIADTKICSICLLSGSTDDSDPIVYCDRCGIIVHESCYNADTLDEKSSDSSSPLEYWFCTSCLGQVDDPICALCPNTDQCQPVWPTLESTWIHVVCALAVPGVLFYDELYYTPVDISNIPSQKFGHKICQICELRSGVTISCDAGLCQNAFHASCANKNGLLQIRGELSKIECELYCVAHQSSSNQYKSVQRNFAICEIQQKELDHRKNFNEEIHQILIDHWNVFQQRSELFPKLPKPAKTHSARSFAADPVALREFFYKSQRLRWNSTDNNDFGQSISNHVDLISPENNALLSFVNNEKELVQLRQKLIETESKLNQLESSTIDDQLREERNQLEQILKEEAHKFNALNERYSRLIEFLEKNNFQLKDSDRNFLIDKHISKEEIDSCSVCQKTDRSSQMIKCCQCRLAFHGDCLTPPMPPKTLSIILAANKKYDWQCALCVNAQQEELDQSHVDIDQPRQIRPRKTNELVLRESFLKFGRKKRSELSSPKQSDGNRKEMTKKKITNEDNHNMVLSSLDDVNLSNDSSRNVDIQSRTSVIQQLIDRKVKDFIPDPSFKRKSSIIKDNSSKKKSKISIKRSSNSTENDDKTPIRSSSFTTDQRHRPIFNKKALSVPLTKSAKKQRIQLADSGISTAPNKDPMSIFDFSSDEDHGIINGNELVELRSSTMNESKIKTSDVSAKLSATSRRSYQKKNKTNDTSNIN